MKIRWLGHSCFIIEREGGTLITDPYYPGLDSYKDKPKASIVTLSHSHPGHSYIEGIANNPRQINGPGEYEKEGVFITGITSFHDDSGGEIKGKNTIYLIEVDDLTLCHLGDLGHRLNPQIIDELGDIDILFLPVGETSTISLDIAVEIVGQLSPRIVIPMHYKTDTLDTNLQTVDKFLQKMGIRESEMKMELSVTSSSLPPNTQVVVLDYLKSL
ncbi:MAG: MBL fold metallo-hydrolase [Dehalococcoidia bacterium]|nr:MBL fold metallo-hydrolase [Dehalococcoidia bacterium]